MIWRAAIAGFPLFAALATNASAQSATARDLQIYFVDVEGGQSTLVVTPRRQSLLIDAGYAGAGAGSHVGDAHLARDANRIAAAARDAGVTQLDYLLITHFHPDHDGGVSELAQLIPIRAYIDHGAPSSEAERSDMETKEAFVAYVLARNGHRHLRPDVGARLPLKGLEVTVVSSAGHTISVPVPKAGASNEACPAHAVPPSDVYENPRSTGILLRYGAFRFLDLGDLTGQPLFGLLCPDSLVGPIDVYLVTHHGGADSDIPPSFAAFAPRVA